MIMHIKDFKPISFLHSISKIISKVLANRLQPKMTNLISSMQSGFITKRSITENFLLASELVQCALKRKKPILVLKLDFHKAFDTVNWKCNIQTLQHRGFDNKWIHWIRTILSSGKTQVLVNGEVGDQISFKRGVRQEDPLSPYLFILVADIFQQELQRAHTDGLILHPLDIEETPPTLQYADDTIILLKGTAQQAIVLKELLDSFVLFSGLKINYHKSTLVPIHMSQQEATSAASTLQCPISSLPCNYLGLPLSTSKISHCLLQPIIDKIDRRLAGWMPGLLSWGGRVIMINSVLSAIPTFYMSCIKWPKRSIEAIDKIRRAFL